MIGPEEPIAAGAADILNSAGFFVCAPTRQASRLEWDKIYMREFLSTHYPSINIPFVVVKTLTEADRFFQKPLWPVAVKPSGLTGGKGVKVEGIQLKTTAEAEAFTKECLLKTGQPVLLEQRIHGVEFTLHCITDDKHTAFCKATYDYSYRLDGDIGLQTGGMGSYCTSTNNLPFMTMNEYQEACQALLKVLSILRKEGISYRGVLQGQFFLSEFGLKICEFACRFGDPEAINLLDTLSCSWVDVMEAIRENKLQDGYLPSTTETSVALCLTPPGYPETSGQGQNFIVGPLEHGVQFLPGACELINTQYRTCGGRAGLLKAVGKDLESARLMIERNLPSIKGLEYRSDVASKRDIMQKSDIAKELRKNQ
jgi:phosphoribosylamine--glycine ligase